LLHRSHQMRAIRTRIRNHTRKRRRIQKDDGQAVRTATASTESPPEPEKGEAQSAITAPLVKLTTLTNYTNHSTLTGNLQAEGSGGSALPQLLVRAINRAQLLILASMQSTPKKSVLNFWLDAKISSYSLLRERREKRGPKASPFFPLPLISLFAKANKKRMGGGKPLSPASCALVPQAGGEPLLLVLRRLVGRLYEQR
jgi:hypothetical protein